MSIGTFVAMIKLLSKSILTPMSGLQCISTESKDEYDASLSQSDYWVDVTSTNDRRSNCNEKITVHNFLP